MPSVSPGLGLVVAATILGSIAVVRRLDDSGDRWGSALRSRLVLGVPWGTLVTCAFVLAVYLFVQDGISNWHQPVTIPYRAWSYFYPLGIAAAPFSHANANHLVGNLVGALVVGSIAEYAWGHYPSERGAGSFSSRLTNPWIRALVVFPLASIAIGLVTSLFSIGYVIGFSGVVFAYAGFALVRHPIAALVGVLGAQGALMTVYRALRQPISVVTAQPSPPSAPWWANIAIQGHALGLFVGLLLAAAVVRRRGYRPDPTRFWVAVLLYGFAQSLWAIYWFRGTDTFVLYRGLGVVVVTSLAIVVTLAVTASDRLLLPASLERRLSRAASPTLERAVELGLPESGATVRGTRRLRSLALGRRPSPSLPFSLPTRRQSALTIVIFVLAFASGPAIPVNLFVPGDDPAASESTVDVRDYSISYAEDVEDPRSSVVNVSAFGEEATVERSGVIVSSPDRQIWFEAVSERELAFRGWATIHVGGPGWRKSVTAIRNGWSATGNGTAYQVWLRPEDGSRRFAHASDGVRADVVVANNTITVVPDDGRFYLEVAPLEGGERTRVEIPGSDETVRAGELRFERDGRAVYAVADGTRVEVASEERYR